jgi:DNA-binding response OmpR family regulator
MVQGADDRPMSGIKVLIVDDSLTFRSTLGDRLRNAGFQTLLAESGYEAIGALQHSPDAVVLDLEMPGLSGIDTCRRIRQAFGAGELPILLLTARDDLPARMQGRAAGADEFLVKASDFPAVANQVVDFVRRSVRVKGRRSGSGRLGRATAPNDNSVLARVVAASGLATIIAETSISRVCQRAGIDAKTMSTSDLQLILTDVERSLSMFLAPEARASRLDAVRAIAGLEPRRPGTESK